jgi:hypothetical protein
MDAEQVPSSEAKAAGATNNLDMEVEDFSSGETGHEQDADQILVDYNEYDPNSEDPVPALKRRANGQEAVPPNDRETKKIALREKLAQNGYALRTVLMNEQIAAHYVSPMLTEDEMSVEDILLAMPDEELRSVAIVQGHIYMPLTFARKYILPTLRQSLQVMNMFMSCMIITR